MRYFLIILILASFVSCKFEKDKLPEHQPVSQDGSDDAVVDANKTLARTEEVEIESYIRRYNWDMIKTESGLRYMIYHDGYGVTPVEGQEVILNYTLTLINGTECYNSDEDGQKLFRVGRAEAERGLHEAVLLMKVGDKAKLILPSALGFGLIGDNDCIPRYATLIYDIELTGVIK